MLAASPSDSATHNDISLLGLVSQLVDLVSTAGLGVTNHLKVFAIFPCMDVQEEAKGVALLANTGIHIYHLTSMSSLATPDQSKVII